MSVLRLCKDPKTGNVTGAYIDDKRIEGFVNVTQTLERGILKATITATFDTVDTCPEEEVIIIAPTLTAVFMAGAGAGTTKALITDVDAAGNHFAYKVLDVVIDGEAGAVAGAIVDGTTAYQSGADIPGVDVGSVVALYELTADNRIVKFLQHTLTDVEVTPGASEPGGEIDDEPTA